MGQSPIAATATIYCAGCDAEKATKPTSTGMPRIPRGWKRANEQTWCKKCWNARYVLRVIVLPVAGPVGTDWPTFRESLQAAWSLSTAASNFITTELYTADVKRRPGMEKLPPPPKTSLYSKVREQFPDLPSGAVCPMETALTAKYRASRFEVLWTGSASLASHRYPVPVSFPPASWRSELGDDNVPLVHVTLPGERFILRLRAGKEFRRQLAAFRQMIDGTAIRGPLAFSRQRANSSDHRNGVVDRANGGGPKVAYRVMCKMIAWLPRTENVSKRSGTLHVRTDNDNLLVATDDKNEPVWTLHADHMRRWQAEYSRRLRHWTDDTQGNPQLRSALANRREAAVLKYRRRMQSAIQEAVAQLANVAKRRRFAGVRYDDSVRTFCGPLPWHDLRHRLMTKLDEYGIKLELATPKESQATSPENAEAIIGDET